MVDMELCTSYHVTSSGEFCREIGVMLLAVVRRGQC